MKMICVQKRSKKIVLSGLLLGSMMSSVTQTKEMSNELVGAIAVATLATLYATRSYWWPSYQHENKAVSEQTEVEQSDEFRSRIAAKRKEQAELVSQAEQQNKLQQQADVENKQKEAARLNYLLKRCAERRQQQEREVAQHKTWNKIDRAQEGESFA